MSILDFRPLHPAGIIIPNSYWQLLHLVLSIVPGAWSRASEIQSEVLMGAYWKQGAWRIDCYEGRRRCRKKTPAKTKTEAKTLRQKVKAKMLPRELGLFDPKFFCAELVMRYLEALTGQILTNSDKTCRMPDTNPP